MTLALMNKALAAMLSGVILASCPVAATAQGLPAMGDGADLTTSAERRLGDRIIRELYRDPDYIDDPVIGDYVQGIWQPLLAAAKARGELSAELDERFAWEILLGRDRTVNAFALPGGYLGVHLGLIGVVATRDELASVLAHELTHVTQRHISRLIAQQSKQTPLLVGALVLAALAASKNPAVTQGLVLGGQALAVQNQLNFSRDMEREADRIGYGLMAPAGFAPQGFVSMFDKLQQANRLNDNGSWPYLRSHPLTTERMADMQSRVPPGGTAAAAAATPAPTLEHAMVAARARVLSNPGIDTLRQWIAEPKGMGYASLPPARRAAVLYAAALGSSQLRDPAGASAYAQQLGALTAQEPAAQRLVGLLNAEMALATTDAAAASPASAGGAANTAMGAAAANTAIAPTAATAALTALAAIAPLRRPVAPVEENKGGISSSEGLGSMSNRGPASTGSTTQRRPELLLRTQALLRAGRGMEATDALQTWVTTHPKDATAWQLLAAVWQTQGQGLRAIRAEAEAQVARYDYAAAVDRFKAGQDLARRGGGGGSAVGGGTAAAVDYIEASIIDTRLRAVGLLLREQAAER